MRSLSLPAEAAPGIFQRRSTWAGLVVLASILGGVWWWQQASVVAPDKEASLSAETTAAESTAAVPPGEAQPGAPPAPVAPTGDVILESKGYIIPAHQILISPKVNGMVLALNFEEGQRVKKDDVLAELESVDYKADVEHAKAVLASSKQKLLELERGNRPEEIAAAKADLAESEAQREQLYSEYKRNIGLRANKTVSETEYEKSESAYKAMDRRVVRLSNNLKLMQEGPRVERIDAARAEVRQSEANLTKAEWRLSNCTITAPISGTILKKNAEEGNVVNPVAFNGSFSLCEMADLSDLEVDLSIQERDIARVRKGQKCKVRCRGLSRSGI